MEDIIESGNEVVLQEKIQYQENEEIQFTKENTPETGFSRTTKRNRETDEMDEEWTLVKEKEKKPRISQYKENNLTNNFIVYISSNEIMPKQFALARLFKIHNITNILRVKYINPYKIRVEFDNDTSAESLKSCSELLSKGWKIQYAMEVNYSYGIIRDIDMDMSEEEIAKNIACTEHVILISAKRLSRRNNQNEGWSPCETVRLCFKGSFLPPYVFIYGMRVKVEPYIHPVTQCSRCWKIGHTSRMCPTKKVVCPKCTNNHSNCEVKTFKCVNCAGTHIALDKSCPVYIKEKRIRELMSEFNCSYARARTMYVPPNSPVTYEKKSRGDIVSTPTERTQSSQRTETFAEVVKVDIHTEEEKVISSPRHRKKKKEKCNASTDIYNDWNSESESVQLENSDNNTYDSYPHKNNISGTKITFNELLTKLKDIIFIKNLTLQTK